LNTFYAIIWWGKFSLLRKRFSSLFQGEEVNMARVGLHARNDVTFPEEDYRLIKEAKIETLKTLSFTDISVYKRLREENPNLEFIVRLWDEGFAKGKHPSPQEFTEKVVPVIQALRPYTVKFEIHNEPNHYERYEGWGPADEDAKDFKEWYMEVLKRLRELCPWAQFGFPGLALNYPHRDLEWLKICREAVEQSDWLGCHCYWQYDNLFSDEWGLRFKKYHELFPDKIIEITEFGDSTPDLPKDEMARKYVAYYRELYKYPYIGSACAFIASSPDPTWASFAWRSETGEFYPVVYAVGKMPRKPPERFFEETGQSVRGAFLELLEKYGLEICGLPITPEVEEEGVKVQYFQNVVMEEASPGKARLRAAGSQLLALKEEVTSLKEEIKYWKLEAEGKAPVVEPFIEDITAKLPKHPVEKYKTRDVSAIKYLIVHHSAIPPSFGPEFIARYHVETRKWPGIGYHYFIDAEGKIYQTNPITVISNHTKGYNASSIGICLAGDLTAVLPTQAQIASLAHLCAYLLQQLGLGKEAIIGHQEAVPTICPGGEWLKGRRWKDIVLKAMDEAPRRYPKRLFHYVLFWQKPDSWARKEWEAATRYIARFRPTCGFSIHDAMQARYVTIIGDKSQIGEDAEELLRKSGCQVERIAKADIAELKKLLDSLARKGKRFLSLP